MTEIYSLETPETYQHLRCIKYHRTESFKFYSSVHEVLEICKIAVVVSVNIWRTACQAPLILYLASR